MFAAVVLLVAFRFPITVNFCLVPFKELIYLTAYVAPVSIRVFVDIYVHNELLPADVFLEANGTL